eukprot:CAMPEP_0196571428 /NCGR_PEP_ID=MMETSP1081-20130531/1620_1 /TAXON_ID=36882 /ORGANISM="Pyramimonas amylifera, Strain CCMP720" /LENGTH=276 /DNA_ID=CAMNT_0041888387 /DNA_START=301 /DNA_END=1128 /DNA_ORIENTATION=+
MDNRVVYLEKKSKEAFSQGAAYQGALEQFTTSYDLRYDIGQALKTVPDAVMDARRDLWSGKKEQPKPLYCCTGMCTIAQLGLKCEPVSFTADIVGKEEGLVRVLIMSPEKPELGITVTHLDLQRHELKGGDDTWKPGQQIVIRAVRVASVEETKQKRAAERLGLKEGACYKGKCTHPFFKPYDIEFTFGKLVNQPPVIALETRKTLGWREPAEACCMGVQSIPEFGAKCCEVVIMADRKDEERRILVVPTIKPEIGISVGCLSADAKEFTGGESDW